MEEADALGKQMRRLGPCCSCLGLLLGLGLGFVGAGWLAQGLASLVVASFFLAVNCVPDEETNPCVLGLLCSALGCLLGYGVGAFLSLARIAGPGSLAAAARLPLFFVLCAAFHGAEFLFAVTCHSLDLSFRAFLLKPVPFAGYSIAMVAALAEYWAWHGLLGPSALPSAAALGTLGMACAVAFGGWAFRTAALFTAASNFTHLVAFEKRDSHQLVTQGVYSWVRHPGYLGWFLWSVGTQLVLGNPLCFLAYGFVSWKFFAGRIPAEEGLLVEFFGNQYLQYAHRVPCGLPCISSLQQGGSAYRRIS